MMKLHSYAQLAPLLQTDEQKGIPSQMLSILEATQ